MQSRKPSGRCRARLRRGFRRPFRPTVPRPAVCPQLAGYARRRAAAPHRPPPGRPGAVPPVRTTGATPAVPAAGRAWGA